MTILLKIVPVLLLATTVLSATVPKTRSIVKAPQNDALVAGPQVVFECEASGTSSRVQWTEFTTSTSGAPISDNADVLPGHPNAARYSIQQPTETTFNLAIEPTVLADGGTYRCSDISDSSTATYAQLVVLDALPNCTTNIPDSGYVREDVYYTIECIVYFKGNAPPHAFWSAPPDVAYGQATTTTNSSVWSGINVNMTRYSSGYTYSVLVNFTEQGFILPNSATNIPTWNYTYSTPELYVQWAPKKMYIVPEQSSYEIGQTIECHADANPSASYFLQNLDTLEFYQGFVLNITESMVGTWRMRCNAANNITGTTYTNDFFFQLVVNPKTTPTTPTTPTTTTTAPAEAECDDLTGRWTAYVPHKVDMCLEVNNTNYGRLLGIVRNATDPYFIEVRGRVAPYQYNQVGFTGVWPLDIGTLTFVGTCKKCYGTENLQINAVGRKVGDNTACAEFGQIYYFSSYLFSRTGPPCRMLNGKLVL